MDRSLDAVAQIRRADHGERGNADRGHQRDVASPGTEKAERERNHQHGYEDEGGAGHHDESHVGKKSEKQRAAGHRQRRSPLPDVDQHQRCKRENRKSEFLALVDVVPDGNAGLLVRRDVQAGSKIVEPGKSHQQRAGRQKRDQGPVSASGPLEAIDQ